ncbi:hypothetical protein M5E88_11460 [Akkermansia muciniphila]|nr:hypothetical protein M5E88_11460 [Akkermansia muciniphila]
MMEAADELDFERAAYLRDIRDNLVKVLEPARRFRKGTPDLPGTVHPEEDMKELGVALGLESPHSLWNALTFPMSLPTISWPPWCASPTAGRTTRPTGGTVYAL